MSATGGGSGALRGCAPARALDDADLSKALNAPIVDAAGPRGIVRDW